MKIKIISCLVLGCFLGCFLKAAKFNVVGVADSSAKAAEIEGALELVNKYAAPIETILDIKVGSNKLSASEITGDVTSAEIDSVIAKVKSLSAGGAIDPQMAAKSKSYEDNEALIAALNVGKSLIKAKLQECLVTAKPAQKAAIQKVIDALK